MRSTASRSSEIASATPASAPPSQPRIVAAYAPRGRLVGRHDQQLAEAPGRVAGTEAERLAARRPALAAVEEGAPQQPVGVAGAQRGEQHRPQPLARVAERGRAQPLAGREPLGLAVERAEADRHDGALGQGGAPVVADHRPAGRLEVDPAVPAPAVAAVAEPQDRPLVGALERAGHQQPQPGGLEQRQERARPGRVLGRGRRVVEVGQGREVVQLVDAQQVAVLPELGQVQLGRCRDRLVGGDVAGKAAARVGGVLGRPYAVGVAEEGAPGRVDERLLGLAAERVARHDPADPLDQGLATAWRHRAEQAGGGDDGESRLAAAGCDGGQDVGQADSAARDRAAEPVDLLLVATHPHSRRTSAAAASDGGLHGLLHDLGSLLGVLR